MDTSAPPPEARTLLLDAAERLMAEHGYAATPVSAICKEVGVTAPTLYWHFGSKEGLLAAIMERGADRWFDALPNWSELTGSMSERAEAAATAGASAVGGHPDFLRLFYTLAIEVDDGSAAGAVVHRVRRQAFENFRAPIRALLAAHAEPDVAELASEELTRFAVAISDGCFFALELEGAQADIVQLFANLLAAVYALTPAAIGRAETALKQTALKQTAAKQAAAKQADSKQAASEESAPIDAGAR